MTRRDPGIRKGTARVAAAALRILGALFLTLATDAALAYRPFDSTDADVAEPGVFELELGPLGRIREGPEKFRVAPAVVANFGLSGERELVLQGQRQTALQEVPGEPRTSIVDTGLFVKQVLRDGVLQDKPGPSVATEVGLLLPTVNGESGAGFSAAGIVSQRSDAGTIHLNSSFAWTRSHEPDLFVGVILEGPYSWEVRPVAEVSGEKISGIARTESVLVGAIWKLRQDLSFDFGIREARAGSEAIHEIRAGLTWSFSSNKEH
ncbi:MAG TPA: hypothetical protein VK572_15740 [Burkholderiales bacterium]|nr:hypothetical protein [Burkholderiales bacterium]